MFKNLLRGIFISLTLLFASTNLFANHILGGEITYKFVRRVLPDSITYEITLKIYRDPATVVPFGPTTDIGAYLETTTTTKPLISPYSLNKISDGQVFASSPFHTSCPVSTGYSIYQVVYKGNVTLPKSNLGYHITWDNYARVNYSTNLNSSPQGITYYAFIPSSNITNNSAAFSDIPVTGICAQDTIAIVNTAKDLDSTDVLKYKFSTPYKGLSSMPDPPVTATLDFPIVPVDYNPGYNSANPLGAGSYVYIDPYTGVATYKASSVGTYVVAVEVSEYRNGVLVGITRRDIVITSKSCGTATRPGPTYSSGGIQKHKFYVKAGEKICFPITFTGANPSDSLLVITTSSIFNSAVTSSPATLSGPLKDKGVVNQQVCWQTDCSQGNATSYKIFSSAKDNVCPQIAPVTSTVEVFVLRNNPVISGPNPFCILQKFVKYTVSDTAVGSTYNWIVTGGIPNRTTGDSIRVDWGNSATGKLMVIETSRAGCKDTSVLSVALNPLPVVSITAAPPVICFHDNTKLTGNGGVSYKWYIQGNPALQSSSNPYNLTPDTTRTYSVVATDAIGCTNSATTSITVNKLPVVTAFSSTDSVCIGNSAQLTGNGAIRYDWRKQGDPTILITAQKYTVSPSIATTYIVTGTDNNNCTNTASKNIYVNPLPNIQIVASADSICPSTRTRLDPKNGVSYLWYNALAPTTAISNDNPYFVSPTITTTYNITGTDIHNCTNTSSKQIYVFPHPQTQPIKGSRHVCPTTTGARYSISGGGSSTSTYHWTVTGNATIQAATQGNDTIKVDFGQADTIHMTVQETNKYGCQGDVIADTIIILKNYVPPAPAGSITVCTIDKNNVSYTAPLGNSDSYYEWGVQGGQILVNDSTPTIHVKWNAVSPPISKIYYTEQSKTAIPACYFHSDTSYVSIYQTPTANKIQGDSSVCKGDKGLLYDLQGMAGSTYQWQIQGGNIQGSTTQNNITVNLDKDTSTAVLKVIETSNHGCPGAQVIQHIIINQPPQAGPITGADVICPSNALQQGYSVLGSIPGSNTSRFKWVVQGGTITAKSPSGKIVTVNWNFTSNNPYISVTEISKDSCVGPTITKGITEDETTAQLLVVSTNEANDKSIDINWAESSRPSGALNTYNLYKRQYGQTPTAPWQPIGIANMVENNYNDAAPTLNTHTTIYEYQYSTKDLCNGITTSKANNSILLGGTGNESSKKVQLKWNNYHNWSRGLQKYEIWRKLDDEPEYTYYSTPATATDTEATYTNGLDGFKHRYRIKSIEAITGKYAWSNDTTITFQHKVAIPNAYSPNGDGVNDRWEIKDIEAYPNTELDIFDRWGAKVYSNTSYKNDWDGRATGGKELPDGTYYYIIKLGGKGAFGIDAMSGNITIVR